MSFANLEAGLDAIRRGRMVILVDDEDRENEGDLCMAAARCTAADINFMARHGRGLICLTLTEERLAQLAIPPMVGQNTSSYSTAFGVSIEARTGVTTGISAADRARTIAVALDPATRPEDLVRPGHMFPLQARRGGVLVRSGQTEGSVDLAQLAGLQPAGVICEIMDDQGEMMRLPALRRFAAQHDLPILTIAELIAYRLAQEPLVHRLVCRHVDHPRWGRLQLRAYGTHLDARQHLAVLVGDVEAGAPLVRVCAGAAAPPLFGDLLTPDHALLETSMQRFAEAGAGVLICIDRDGPAPSLADRVQAWGEPQSATAPKAATCGELREVGLGAQILREIGVGRIRVLSGQARRMVGLDAYGITVEAFVSPAAPVAAGTTA